MSTARERAVFRARFAREMSDPAKREAKRKRDRSPETRARRRVLRSDGRYQVVSRERQARLRHGRESVRETLIKAQNGLCYLCEEPLPDYREAAKTVLVVVDHDHRCCPPQKSCVRCRRGVAHNFCNFIIGAVKDDPAKLRRIADNLAAAQARIDGNLPDTLFDVSGLSYG